MAAAALATARGELNILLLAVRELSRKSSVGKQHRLYLLGRTGGLRLLRKTGLNTAREAKAHCPVQRYGGGFHHRGARAWTTPATGIAWWRACWRCPGGPFRGVQCPGGRCSGVGVWGLETYYLWEHVSIVHTLWSASIPGRRPG